MEQKVLKFSSKPVLCVCSSNRSIDELVASSKRMSRDQDFVLLLDYNESAVARALPAFVNARIRLHEKMARSGSAQMEMLLLVCGTMNIGKALKQCGAKNPRRFLLFSTRRELFDRFVKSNGIKAAKKISMRLDPEAAASVTMTELTSE